MALQDGYSANICKIFNNCNFFLSKIDNYYKLLKISYKQDSMKLKNLELLYINPEMITTQSSVDILSLNMVIVKAEI